MLTLENHSPYLILDAAMPDLQVGLLGQKGLITSFHTQEPALESLFSGIEHCLKSAQCEFSDIGGFIYCEGPGGKLGLRIVAMALRTWRVLNPWNTLPLYSYHAFNAAVGFIQATTQDEEGNANALFASEIGKDKFYGLKGGFANDVKDITILSPTELNQHQEQYPDKLYWLPQRKIWQQMPKHAHSAHYSIESISQLFYDASWLRKVEEPQLWHSDAPSFKKWDAKPHTAL
jgi:tRNA threonylcarbamoyladenosine biosynthesis protein TsaB